MSQDIAEQLGRMVMDDQVRFPFSPSSSVSTDSFQRRQLSLQTTRDNNGRMAAPALAGPVHAPMHTSNSRPHSGPSTASRGTSSDTHRTHVSCVDPSDPLVGRTPASVGTDVSSFGLIQLIT
jgi:hypothetical protein